MQTAFVLCVLSACTTSVDEEPTDRVYPDAGHRVRASSSSSAMSGYEPPASEDSTWHSTRSTGGGGGGHLPQSNGTYLPPSSHSSSSGIQQAITIEPARPIIAWGTEQALFAALISPGTSEPITQEVQWSSSSPSIVEIRDGAVMRGAGAGTATITATARGLTATVEVLVLEPVTTGITLSASELEIPAGMSQRIGAVAAQEDGNTRVISSAASWSSSNVSIADVDSSGRVRGIVPGSAIITARFLSFEAQVQVHVTTAALRSLVVNPPSSSLPLGGIREFTAMGTFTDDTSRTLTGEVAWSSSNPLVVDEDPQVHGRFITRSTGHAQINASLAGLTAVAFINVTPATLDALEVIAPVVIPSGASVPFAARGRFSDGTEQDLTEQVLWSVDDTASAIILDMPGSHGLFTALSPGNVVVTATFGTTSSKLPITISDATLTALAITPPSPRIAEGTFQELSVMGFYSDDSSLDVTRQVSWTSSDPRAVTIMDGVAQGLAAGSSVVTASMAGVSESTVLSVSNATPSSIRISPPNAHVAHGSTLQLAASVTFSDGTTQDLTRVATWSSSEEQRAAISRGLLTGIARGTSTITARWRGASISSVVTVDAPQLTWLELTPATPVLPDGSSQQLVATGTFSDGSTQDLTRSVVWASSNNAVVSTSSAGVVRAEGEGTATITASINGLSSSTSIRVTAASLTQLSISPSELALPIGRSQHLVVTGTWSDGSTQDVSARAAWTSANPQFVVVTGPGDVRAISTGASIVTASIDAMSASVTVTGTPARLASLDVTVPAEPIAQGRALQLSAEATMTDGTRHTMDDQPAWSSSDTRIARVDAAGRLTAVAPGTCSISATSDGIVGSALITVTAAVLQSIQVSTSTTRLAQGTSVQLVAEGVWSNGRHQQVTPAWSSSASSVVTMSSRGIAHAVAAGSSVISAVLGGVRTDLTLVVTPASLVALEIGARSQELPLGYKQRFTATGTFSDGSRQDLTTQVSWSSSENVRFSSSQPGTALATAQGDASISASFSGITRTASLVVTNATLRAISVSPSSLSIAVDDAAALRATGTFSSGAELDLTEQVMWSSSDVTVVNVSNALDHQGQLVGIGQGDANVTAAAGGLLGVITVQVR